MSFRRTLTLGKKLEIIAELERIEKDGGKMNFTLIAQRHEVDRTTIGRIYKARDTLKERGNQYRLTMKHKTPIKGEDVAAALHAWLRGNRYRAKHLISQPTLRKKAIALANEMGYTFNPSNSWLCRFKFRYGLSFSKGKEKKEQKVENVVLLTSEDFRSHFLFEIFQRYDGSNIFNASETGIYFRGLSHNDCSPSDHAFDTNERLNDRCTALVCANMSGTEKCKLLVIGNSRRPSSFPHDTSSLPVTYKCAVNSWMTRDIFQEYLCDWNEGLRIQNRKILLMLDSCPPHLTDLSFSHIEIVYLPHNAMDELTVVQPMTMGVIRTFKSHYRTLLNKRIISTLDMDGRKTAMEAMKAITFLDAIYMLNQAWNSVSYTAIEHSFVRVCLAEDQELVEINFPVPPNLTQEEFDEMIDQDRDLKVSGVLSNAELVNPVKVEWPDPDEENMNDYDEEVKDAASGVKCQELLASLNTLRIYIQRGGKTHLINNLEAIEEEVAKDVQLHKMQMTISSNLKQDF